MKKKQFLWEWFAGFVDGDGTIGIFVNRREPEEHTWGFTPSITVYNTHVPTMKWLEKTLGGYLAETSYDPKTQKPCYSLNWRGDNARNIIKEILPFLVIKEGVAQVVLDLPQRRKGRGNEVYNRKIVSKQLKSLSKVKSLNNRGKEK